MGSTESEFFHVPVLLHESVDLLVWKSSGRYVDATVGGGGHAEAILQRLGPSGLLVGIDWDDEAIAHVRERLRSFGKKFLAIRANYADLDRVIAELGLDAVDGVLFDLGVSSRQIDRPERGFSFDRNGPLDLRMDRRRLETAADVVNRMNEAELARIFRELGEEPRARTIARRIVEVRSRQAIETTRDLAEIVKQSVRGPRVAKSLARVFQALRIYVNQELENLTQALRAAVALLAPGGRIVAISYHSLEDRIVKNFFRENEPHCICPPHSPVCTCGTPGVLRVLTRAPVRASEEEVRRNPRARSARLRAAEKLADTEA